MGMIMIRIDKEDFKRGYCIVGTRCFSSKLQNRMLIPYADCFNHDNVDAEYHVINTILHANIDQSMNSYYLKQKMSIDCSILVGEKKPILNAIKELTIDDNIYDINLNKESNWENEFLSIKENNIWNMYRLITEGIIAHLIQRIQIVMKKLNRMALH